MNQNESQTEPSRTDFELSHFLEAILVMDNIETNIPIGFITRELV